MAMSKEDFIAIGENTYRKGGLRPFGNSWQIKAQQQGFDCAETDAFDARQDEAKAHAIELDVLAGKSSPQKQATKATDSPSKADENQSEGVGSLTVENRAVEGGQTLAESVTATGQKVLNEMILNNDVLSGMVSSDTDSLWQTKTPEQILTDIHSVIENLRKPEEEYQRPSDPLAHHIELLIEQAVKEPNAKRMLRLMTKINNLRYRQMKLVSVYMRNGAGMYLFKD